MLRSKLGRRIPARIEQHKDRSNTMRRRNRQKAVDPFLNPSGPVPELILQKHPRIVFMPIFSAQPNSLSMRLPSKVSASDISSSLIAYAGR